MRLADKINWVYKITNIHINANKELQTLYKFKDIRNHLNHFDPPCFVLNIFQITDWLNEMQEIGILLLRIREAIDEPGSEELYNFLLQPKVTFNPGYNFNFQIYDVANHAYESSNW